MWSTFAYLLTTSHEESYGARSNGSFMAVGRLSSGGVLPDVRWNSTQYYMYYIHRLHGTSRFGLPEEYPIIHRAPFHAASTKRNQGS